MLWKLKFNHYQLESQSILELSGQIDESFSEELIKLAYQPEIILDLTLVESINSLGIRDWIKFLNELHHHRIYLKHCPKVIIDQINMVQGFLPKHCRVVSFFIPYFNKESHLEKNVLIELDQSREITLEKLCVEKSIFDENKREFEIDVVTQKYFKFLINQSS